MEHSRRTLAEADADNRRLHERNRQLEVEVQHWRGQYESLLSQVNVPPDPFATYPRYKGQPLNHGPAGPNKAA